MLDVRFGAIVDVIKEFSINVQKIKNFKTEMIEMITL